MAWKRWLSSREAVLLIMIIALGVAIQCINPAFLSLSNGFDLLKSCVVTGLLALGATLVLISGGIDISFAAVAVFSMYVTTRFAIDVDYAGSVVWLFAMAGAMGLVLGLGNACLISFLRLPALIVTLGTASLFQGFLWAFVGSKILTDLPAPMVAFSRAMVFRQVLPEGGMTGLSVSVFIFGAAAVLTGIMLRYTLLGRSIYAMGGNADASSRAGISLTRVRLFVYGVVGVLAGVAGLVHAMSMRNANPFDLADDLLLVIAAAVLGGAGITGGRGSAVGTVLGVFFLVMVDNSLILAGIPSQWNKVVIGLTIVVSCALSEGLFGRKAGAGAVAGALYGKIMSLASRKKDFVQMLVMAVLIAVIMETLRPGRFLTGPNINAMAFQIPELGFFALAIMVSLITGGIDLSVVSSANLAGVLAALVLTRLCPAEAGGWVSAGWIAAALGVALATGLACGLINGVLIGCLKITPILATLGTMQLFTGIALVITRGPAVADYPEAFLVLGNGTVGGIPIPLILFAALVIVVGVVLKCTPFGVSLYLLGANERAARYSGIPAASVQIKTYLMTGVLAAMAGLVIMARFNSAEAEYGSIYLLQAVLVAILGGVNPAGGKGGVGGLVLALVTLQMLSSGFNMLRAGSFIKEFAWGAYLILVMVLNHGLGRMRKNLGS